MTNICPLVKVKATYSMTNIYPLSKEDLLNDKHMSTQ